MTAPDQIRNFSIIAHIDHGKSTIADRLIQVCGGLTDREMTDQVLDNMDIERERGITIKAQTVRLNYKAEDGKNYVLNLMDTPGHVDFGYEVSRSLSACEGSLLVVDASQGVEAQTLANVYQAVEADHEIVPVLNKIDLPAAEPERVQAQIEEVIGLPADDAIQASAKTGAGISDILEAVVKKMPPPVGEVDAPVVFCGLFPVDTNDFSGLREALEKLSLNDASFSFEAETSAALGFGFRCGFLGLLHMEVIRDRLEREFNLDLISTAPSVVYQMTLTDGTQFNLHNPADMPEVTRISEIEEPWIKATIMTPDEYLGAVLTLCTERRGEQLDLTYAGNRAMAVYRLPLNEVVFDFYDRLKSVTRGYASFDYAIDEYRLGELVKVSILVNGDLVDALSMIVHREQAEHRGRAICVRLKDLVPRQMFKVALQAAIGGKVIARETISALRKDVTAKCYGGDISRKKKLLEKQKEGKKKMRQFGKVDIPQNAFFEALKMGDS